MKRHIALTHIMHSGRVYPILTMTHQNDVTVHSVNNNALEKFWHEAPGNGYKNICGNVLSYNLWRQKTNQWLPRVRVQARIHCKWLQGNFGVNRNDLTLDCGETLTKIKL